MNTTFKSNKAELNKRIARGAQAGLKKSMGRLVNELADDIVLRDTNATAESASVGVIEGSKNKPTIKGGYKTPYAPHAHEMSDFTPTTPGTKSKFLEDPARDNAQELFSILATEIVDEVNA